MTTHVCTHSDESLLYTLLVESTQSTSYITTLSLPVDYSFQFVLVTGTTVVNAWQNILHVTVRALYQINLLSFLFTVNIYYETELLVKHQLSAKLQPLFVVCDIPHIP